MEKNSTPSPFLSTLLEYASKGWIPEKFQGILKHFFLSYEKALKTHGLPSSQYVGIIDTFVKLIKEQFQKPYAFEPYHQQIREPFDYYAFGLEFLRPLVDMKASSMHGLKIASEIEQRLAARENVILLANHQIEADPQAISLLLEKSHPKLGQEMIFVAGERVLTDPLAVPFSMGRNLLCIYSKRYIDFPPEQKMKKQLHNKRTMELMSELLSEGGKCIYVAPSGGRDRPNAQGVVEVAEFDPQSIEMFHLMAKRAKQPTHFYTLALKTYDLLPPPETIQVELGELRSTKGGGIHLAFGPKIDMEHFPGHELEDKHARRKARADFIRQQVNKDYQNFR